MSQVIIGMDPHKRSATIEVMAGDEAVVGGGRYATDAAGYAAMLAAARHVDVLEALDEDLGAHLFRVGHRLARALRRSSLPCAG